MSICALRLRGVGVDLHLRGVKGGLRLRCGCEGDTSLDHCAFAGFDLFSFLRGGRALRLRGVGVDLHCCWRFCFLGFGFCVGTAPGGVAGIAPCAGQWLGWRHLNSDSWLLPCCPHRCRRPLALLAPTSRELLLARGPALIGLVGPGCIALHENMTS